MGDRFSCALVRRALGLFLALSLIVFSSDFAHAKPTKASIVVDAETGAVLSSSNADVTAYPASLTKMMTLYMLFEALEGGRISLDDQITFSKYSAAKPATNLASDPGDRIRVETAILALVVRSANDVAAAVGETLAGSESGFAKLMTNKARELGMDHTTFRNASGLPDDGQRTTARDMAILGIALLRDFPQYYGYFKRNVFQYGGVTYTGHNRLLQKLEGADGIKTGYIRASGFNLVSSAERDGRRLVGVVLGGSSASSRDVYMASLLETGFTISNSKAKSVLIAKAPNSGSMPETTPTTQTKVANAAKSVEKVTIHNGNGETQDVTVGAGDAIDNSDDQEFQALLAAASIPDILPQLRPGTILREGAGTSASQQTVNVWKSGGDGYGVQVGAFSRFAAAETAAQKASAAEPDLLGEARIVVDTQKMNNGSKVYRARILGLSKTEAESACRNLRAGKTDCLVFKSDANAVAMSN